MATCAVSSNSSIAVTQPEAKTEYTTHPQPVVIPERTTCAGMELAIAPIGTPASLSHRFRGVGCVGARALALIRFHLQTDPIRMQGRNWVYLTPDDFARELREPVFGKLFPPFLAKLARSGILLIEESIGGCYYSVNYAGLKQSLKV